VAEDFRNKEIAVMLSISERVTKLHLHTIYEELGVDDCVALLGPAQQKGLT
jgi:DNA-binding CsgD family transcriptional regulator